ncbi:Ureidoglycolate lyase [Bienertia sinuspersici]
MILILQVLKVPSLIHCLNCLLSLRIREVDSLKRVIYSVYVAIDKFADAKSFDLAFTWKLPVVWTCSKAPLLANRFLMGIENEQGAIVFSLKSVGHRGVWRLPVLLKTGVNCTSMFFKLFLGILRSIIILYEYTSMVTFNLLLSDQEDASFPFWRQGFLWSIGACLDITLQYEDNCSFSVL